MHANLAKGPHMNSTNLISIEKIEKTIYLIRGEKVMLDRDLAELYQVQTKALNQAVSRNAERFPSDFMFQLSEKEVAELNRSQFVTGPRSTAIRVRGPMLLLNRASPCFRLFCAASVP